MKLFCEIYTTAAGERKTCCTNTVSRANTIHEF